MVTAVGTITHNGQRLAWRLAPCLAQLAAQIEARWPGTTVYSIGDAAHDAQGLPSFDATTGRATGGTDHLPDVLGRVCAIDVMHSPTCDAHALFDALRTFWHPSLSYLELENVAPFAGRKMGCGLYTGRAVVDAGPSTAGPHVHVSVLHLPKMADDRSPWTISAPAPQPVPHREDDMELWQSLDASADGKVPAGSFWLVGAGPAVQLGAGRLKGYQDGYLAAYKVPKPVVVVPSALIATVAG